MRRPWLTDTQKRALERLRQHGGEGVRMKNGCVLARGVVLRYGDYAAQDHEPDWATGDKLTWPVFERLRDAGCVEIDGARVRAL